MQPRYIYTTTIQINKDIGGNPKRVGVESISRLPINPNFIRINLHINPNHDAYVTFNQWLDYHVALLFHYKSNYLAKMEHTVMSQCKVQSAQLNTATIQQ